MRRGQPIQSQVDERWPSQITDAGWVKVPKPLFEKQAELNIGDEELVVILQILVFWQKKDRLPFPAVKTLAKRIGKSSSRVRGVLYRLRDKGLMKIIQRPGDSNIYDPEPLIRKLLRATNLSPGLRRNKQTHLRTNTQRPYAEMSTEVDVVKKNKRSRYDERSLSFDKGFEKLSSVVAERYRDMIEKR